MAIVNIDTNEDEQLRMVSPGGATGLNLREDERMYFGGVPKTGNYRCVHSDVIRWVPPVFNLTSAFWSRRWVLILSRVSSGQRWFWRDSLAVWKTLKFPERRTICWAAQTTQDWPKAAPLRYSNTAPSCLCYCLSALKATFAQFKYFSTSTLSFKGKSEEN